MSSTDEAGSEAADNAVAAIDGARVESGDYTVVFGPQPVADLCNNLIVPSCQAGSFFSSSTPFLGHLGKPVAAPGLSIYDHGAMRGLAGSRGITCEGLPTGRTDLIKDGVLVGLLSHWYDTERLLHDPEGRRKLGWSPPPRRPRSGRATAFATTGRARSFETTPGTSATNVVLEGRDAVPLDRLLARVARWPLRRAHLVHVPDQRVASGRLHLYGGGGLLYHPRRSDRVAAQGEHAPHQRQPHAAARGGTSARRRTPRARSCGERTRSCTRRPSR